MPVFLMECVTPAFLVSVLISFIAERVLILLSKAEIPPDVCSVCTRHQLLAAVFLAYSPGLVNWG